MSQQSNALALHRVERLGAATLWLSAAKKSSEEQRHSQALFGKSLQRQGNFRATHRNGMATLGFAGSRDAKVSLVRAHLRPAEQRQGMSTRYHAKHITAMARQLRASVAMYEMQLKAEARRMVCQEAYG